MKMILAGIFFVIWGCSSKVSNRYEDQVRNMEEYLSKGDLSCFDGLDEWGRGWNKIYCTTNESEGRIVIRSKFLSSGENTKDDNDDLEVSATQYFEEGELTSWGYSYMYSFNGCLECGGSEYDN